MNGVLKSPRVSDTLRVDGKSVDTPVTVSVTNGQAISTISGSFYILTGYGGPDASTNTVTIPNPSYDGQVLDVMVSTNTTASSNLVLFADSDENLDLGGSNVLLDNSDMLSLRGIGTVIWVKRFSTDN